MQSVFASRAPQTAPLCSAAAALDLSTRRKNAYLLLGLQPGASPKEIKMRYYDLAKQSHPDVLANQAREAAAKQAAHVGPKVASYDAGVLDQDHSLPVSVVPFLELQTAYDTLMEEDGDAAGAGPSSKPKRRAGQAPPRQRTLGEVLCDRLKDEPEAHGELWEEIVRDKMPVTEPMLDAFFSALVKWAGRDHKLEGARVAQRIIYDGTYHGLLTIDTRCSALCSLLSFCQANEEELGDLAFEIVDQISDEDRAHSPAVMAAIGAVFCSGTRSPY